MLPFFRFIDNFCLWWPFCWMINLFWSAGHKRVSGSERDIKIFIPRSQWSRKESSGNCHVMLGLAGREALSQTLWVPKSGTTSSIMIHIRRRRLLSANLRYQKALHYRSVPSVFLSSKWFFRLMVKGFPYWGFSSDLRLVPRKTPVCIILTRPYLSKIFENEVLGWLKPSHLCPEALHPVARCTKLPGYPYNVSLGSSSWQE